MAFLGISGVTRALRCREVAEALQVALDLVIGDLRDTTVLAELQVAAHLVADHFEEEVAATAIVDLQVAADGVVVGEAARPRSRSWVLYAHEYPALVGLEVAAPLDDRGSVAEVPVEDVEALGGVVRGAERIGVAAQVVDVPTLVGLAVAQTGPLDAIVTYYISPFGNDLNPGTIDQPWRTFQQSLPKLHPGATLVARGGRYFENVMNPSILPGLEAARITVARYPGESPIIQGLLWLESPSYWTFSGIQVTWNNANSSN